MKVTIYNTNNCYFSHFLKRELQEKEIQFEEVNVLNHSEIFKELYLRGQYGVPAVEIDGEIVSKKKLKSMDLIK